MTTMFTTEFWVAFQMLTILLLLGLLVYFIRHSRSGAEPVREEDDAGIPEAATKVVELMEPLIKEAEATARLFESQIMEKKKLIHSLNEKLDNRIISLNLLLNRADACLARNEEGAPEPISATQEDILALYGQGLSSQAISDKLSVSGQEVDLVISLKKKFVALEKGS